MTHKEKVLTVLKTNGSITPKEAWEWFGCYRLSGVIYKLRGDGHNIETTMVQHPRHNGAYARYCMRGQMEIGI